MSIGDSERSFGWLTIVNHWLTVLLVVSLLYVGFHMAGLPRGPGKLQLIEAHRSIGLIVLVLALLRLLWRILNPMPEMLGSPSPRRQRLARGVQTALLGLIILMPLSGWLMSSAGGHPVSFFGIMTLPNLAPQNKLLGKAFHALHEIIGFAIIGLLAGHVLAAFKHAFIDRDNTLKRMLGRADTRL